MEEQLNNTQNQSIQLPEAVKSHLGKAAKWAKFLAIVGFVMLGFLVILSLSVGSLLRMAPTPIPNVFGTMYTITILIVVAIYFFPIFYLYQFAVKAQNALQTDDVETLEHSFDAMRKLYTFMGILMIVVLVIYALSFLFGMLFASALTGM